jgi:hypothetical protein
MDISKKIVINLFLGSFCLLSLINMIVYPAHFSATQVYLFFICHTVSLSGFCFQIRTNY